MRKILSNKKVGFYRGITKAVIQAIPTYCIRVFRLPHALCNVDQDDLSYLSVFYLN
jgi:hypothetical protein